MELWPKRYLHYMITLLMAMMTMMIHLLTKMQIASSINFIIGEYVLLIFTWKFRAFTCWAFVHHNCSIEKYSWKSKRWGLFVQIPASTFSLQANAYKEYLVQLQWKRLQFKGSRMKGVIRPILFHHCFIHPSVCIHQLSSKSHSCPTLHSSSVVREVS